MAKVELRIEVFESRKNRAESRAIGWPRHHVDVRDGYPGKARTEESVLPMLTQRSGDGSNLEAIVSKLELKTSKVEASSSVGASQFEIRTIDVSKFEALGAANPTIKIRDFLLIPDRG